MTALVDSHLAQALRRAAVRATAAPSVHNTQPWKLVVGADWLEIRADWSRQLKVLDPTGRQLLISCGCALFNARASLENSGYQISVARSPDVTRPDILARLSITGRAEDRAGAGYLDALIDLRSTNRRRFADDAVDAAAIEDMIAAARAEDAQLIELTRAEQRQSVALLTQKADVIQNSDPGYRAELRSWTTTDNARLDGVRSLVVPHVTGDSRDDLPLRDFDTQGLGFLPADTHSTVDQCLLLLATAEETPSAWLRAGEALERVWLEAVRHGYTMSLFTSLIEVQTTRQALRNDLQMSAHPHVLLRVGRAPSTPSTRRRRLVDVLIEAP